MSIASKATRDILVVGCGSIGKRHIRNLVSMGIGRVIGFDVSDARRGAVESETGIKTVSTLDEALGMNPAVAVIATPSSLHVPLAIEVARRGCDIFVEKPLAHELDSSVDDLLSMVRQQKLITMVGCNMRFHPGPERVKQCIAEGAIGDILFARVFAGSYLPEWHPDEDYRKGYSANASMGGGCILDGIHEIDLARWYLGEVDLVGALVSHISELEMDVEDLASISLRHVNGAHSEVHLDYVQRVRIRGCVIAGTEGTLTWDWSQPVVRMYQLASRCWLDMPLATDWCVDDMYRAEMRHFFDRVERREQSCLPMDEAVRVTKVALAAKQSQAEQRFIAL